MVSKSQLICFLLLSASSRIVFAEDVLDELVITEESESNHEDLTVQKITAEDIENSNTGNGFISDVLTLNPNVQVQDKSKNSKTAGEITPGKISINGTPFYQNNMTIDGVSNNSIIDPALSDKFNRYDVSGNENNVFIDLDLIEEINVYDSNVSAEYGHFLGGVIDVKTKRVQDDFSAKLSYKTTSSDVTNFHIHSNDLKGFSRAETGLFQPVFEKEFYNFYVGTPLSENSGLLLQYSRKESVISGGYFQGFKNYYQKNENFLLKHSYYFDDDSILDTSLVLAPYEATYFDKMTKDSESKEKGGGNSFKLNYEKTVGLWDMEVKFGLSQSQNTRVSNNKYKEWKVTRTKPWGGYTERSEEAVSKEGGFGSIEKTEVGADLNLKLESKTLKLSNLTHKLKTGMDLSHDKATYNRKRNSYYTTKPVFESNINCNGDVEDCLQNEQYLSERRIYKKEKVSVDMQSVGVYFEDKIRYKRFEFSPGLRVDYNSFLQNIDVAYRLNGKVNVFDNISIYGGANRYYGKSFLGHKLRKARLPYYEESRGTRQNVLQDWQLSVDQDLNQYQYENLETPFSDELSIGVAYNIFSTRFNLKMVTREGRNQFTSTTEDYEVFTRPDGITKAYYKPKIITNDGKTSSKITSLKIDSLKPLKLGAVNLSYALSTSWREQKINFATYDDSVEDEKKPSLSIGNYNDEMVSLVKLQDNPFPKVYNFNLGLKFKPLSLFGSICNVSLNNMFNYTLPYTIIIPNSNGDTVIHNEDLPDGSKKQYDILIYEDLAYQESLIYNLKLGFDFTLAKKHHLIANFEIDNVFDTVQKLENDYLSYRLGRQFWFNVQYKY